MSEKEKDKVFVKAHFRKKKKGHRPKPNCETCLKSDTYCIFNHTKQAKEGEPSSVLSRQSSERTIDDKMTRYKQLGLSSDSSSEEYLPIKKPPSLPKGKKTVQKVKINCQTRKKMYLLSSDSEEDKLQPESGAKLKTG